jgi:hypothetical protein
LAIAKKFLTTFWRYFMNFQLYAYDENGKPTMVETYDGFALCCREFDPIEDGWMLKQLDPRDFPAIQIGRDTEYLVSEVNRLRRELDVANRILNEL